MAEKYDESGEWRNIWKGIEANSRKLRGEEPRKPSTHRDSDEMWQAIYGMRDEIVVLNKLLDAAMQRLSELEADGRPPANYEPVIAELRKEIAAVKKTYDPSQIERQIERAVTKYLEKGLPMLAEQVFERVGRSLETRAGDISKAMESRVNSALGKAQEELRDLTKQLATEIASDFEKQLKDMADRVETGAQRELKRVADKVAFLYVLPKKFEALLSELREKDLKQLRQRIEKLERSRPLPVHPPEDTRLLRELKGGRKERER